MEETQTENVQTENQTTEEVKSTEPVGYKEDMFKFKKQARDAQSELDRVRVQLKEAEERSLAEKSNYKELAERRLQEINDLKSKSDNERSAWYNHLKMKEVEKVALSQGLRKEALDDLRFNDDEVILETTSTGGLNVVGASEFVDKLKQTRPYWFKEQGAPKVNTGNPGYTPGKELTASDLLKLEKTDPVRYREEIMKRINRPR